MQFSTRIGIDLVQVAAIERSMTDFGARFTHRLFAPGELADSTRDGRLDAAALATRFAAKEATIKAFDLCEAGIGWSQIEMVDAANGQARMRLHGEAARRAAAGAGAGADIAEIAVASSYVGDMACAIVVALPSSSTRLPIP